MKTYMGIPRLRCLQSCWDCISNNNLYQYFLPLILFQFLSIFNKNRRRYKQKCQGFSNRHWFGKVEASAWQQKSAICRQFQSTRLSTAEVLPGSWEASLCGKWPPRHRPDFRTGLRFSFQAPEMPFLKWGKAVKVTCSPPQNGHFWCPKRKSETCSEVPSVTWLRGKKFAHFRLLESGFLAFSHFI